MHPLCLIKTQNQQINAYKGKEESGFEAFGMSFVSTNNLDTYFFFVKSLKRAVEFYTKNPAVESAMKGLEDLREILKQNMRVTQ